MLFASGKNCSQARATWRMGEKKESDSLHPLACLGLPDSLDLTHLLLDTDDSFHVIHHHLLKFLDLLINEESHWREINGLNEPWSLIPYTLIFSNCRSSSQRLMVISWKFFFVDCTSSSAWETGKNKEKVGQRKINRGGGEDPERQRKKLKHWE